MDDDVWLPIDGMISTCEKGIASLNDATVALLGGGHGLLKPLSLPKPGKGCSELVFLRTVFWLSALFHECGGRALKFCVRQTQFDDPEDRSGSFLRELRSLRTQAAHNLNPSLECDVTTNAICENFFKRICQTRFPLDDMHWDACSVAVLSKATELIGSLLSFLEILQSMSDSEALREGLIMAISSDFSPYAFDDVVKSVAADLGRSDLNLQKFRADHLQHWKGALDKLQEGYDFSYEARRLVEGTFLENPERPPITGREIIEILGVPPGKGVGRVLEHGKRLFREGVREREALLDKLREYVDSNPTGGTDR